jgi:hypothetical protein
MKQAALFLPDFNVPYIENYYCNDYEAITEIFEIANLHLEEDLYKVKYAFDNKDIIELRDALHGIIPGFNSLGLLDIEEKVNDFYNLCNNTSMIEVLHCDFIKLWSQLEKATTLIKEQNKLFVCLSGSGYQQAS